ncbi:MAG: phosphodiester glycosidase family protein [Lachnospiraceae bacterium]|jgi:hypothetical protein|nr:phosphodiester glycosidase family protein [Lachnospiraceae bacterium]
MKRKLELTDYFWSYGCYPRGGYKTDMLYTFYQYKDFTATYNIRHLDIEDRLAEQLYEDGLVPYERRPAYQQRLLYFAQGFEQYDQWPVEKIYGELHRMRRKFFGEEALEKEQKLRMERRRDFQIRGGIDQSRKKRELMERSRAVIFALCEPEMFYLMKEDLEEVLRQGKTPYVLVSPGRGDGLPSRAIVRSLLGPVRCLEDQDENLGFNPGEVDWEEELQAHIDTDRALLLAYGDEGLMQCRRLRVNAVVSVCPSCYYTKAMTNQLDGGRPSVICVPKHFDITDWVRLTEKTILSYWQLARLWEDQGDEVYGKSVAKMYRAWPQYFINIYENGDSCPEAAEDYPIRIEWPKGGEEKAPGEVFGDFYRLREKAIGEYLNGKERLTYLSAYFDENMEEREIPWCAADRQKGILVQGIRTGRAEKSRVIHCGEGLTLRQQLKGRTDSLLILSNFLFFVTPKLAWLYNDLRRDRPMEQLEIGNEHLDYMLYKKDGLRVESFPLFHKACIAMKEDGSFLFFRYRLGGGSLSVSGYTLSWRAEDVDVCEEASGGARGVGYAGRGPQPGGFGCVSQAPVRVYTPYYSRTDAGGDAGAYRALVGAGRINLVIIQNRIVCIRDGEVVLPSIGAVVSLDRRTGEAFRRAVGCAGLGRGYYSCCGLSLTICLDGPEEIPPQEWEQVTWAYGGGMSLILNGQNVLEGGESCLEEEGWMSPLSRQTQETDIHKMTRHPRTALGITKNGDLFILVYSGRTKLSVGADYGEMCRIARKLFPDVVNMMGADGGGSSMLGASIEGSFLELSCPATSAGSCAGMARPVHTVLCLE